MIEYERILSNISSVLFLLKSVRSANKSSSKTISNILQIYSSRIHTLEQGVPSAFAKCKKDMDSLFNSTEKLGEELNNLRGITGNQGEFNDIVQKQKQLDTQHGEIVNQFTSIRAEINKLDDTVIQNNATMQEHIRENTTKFSLLETRLADRYLYKSIDELRDQLEVSNSKINTLTNYIQTNTLSQEAREDIKNILNNKTGNIDDLFLAQCKTGNFWCIPTTDQPENNDDDENVQNVIGITENAVSTEIANEITMVKSNINENNDTVDNDGDDEDDEDNNDMPTFPTVYN